MKSSSRKRSTDTLTAKERSTNAPTVPGGAEVGSLPLGSDAPHAELLDAELEPGAREVRERLLEHGASPEFTARVIEKVIASKASGAYAIDFAARVLGTAFSILPSPRRTGALGKPHVFVFAGPTGAGKTTSLAKLGRKLMLAGRGVVFASLRTPSTAALERVGTLDSDLDKTEIPLIAVSGADDLYHATRRMPRADVVLLDTPSLATGDTVEIDELAREMERIGELFPVDPLLVLSSTSSRSFLERSTAAFDRLSPTGAVLTKLDESDEPGVAMEHVQRAALPIAFLCDGQDARGNIRRPSANRLADLLLRGRVV